MQESGLAQPVTCQGTQLARVYAFYITFEDWIDKEGISLLGIYLWPT